MKCIKLKDVFVLLIKYIPIIQMVGMLFNNILYYFELYRVVCYTLDFSIGNSIVTTFLLLVCSNLFGFYNWHRLIIISNFVNLTIANIDAIIGIPVSDLGLILLYIIVYMIFLFIIVYKKFCK